VSRDGSIDWLCWPHFASPACFASLVGTEDNGRWLLSPAGTYKSTRRYLEPSLVLETRFVTGEGSVAVLDFMPIGSRDSRVVRLVQGLSGQVKMRMELRLRFG